ncbi:phosphotransferase [Variovorax boronicumulans]|uniref:phosphotransferase n=1 Tax=Variovorax boronicumulans TaxID=436515 RepID=UPI00085C5E04|nr:phosphotransferase [Variovorax boronicumulans]OEZ27400.1 aminoglycoside phosphotransferase [Variovorax boronicumulans]
MTVQQQARLDLADGALASYLRQQRLIGSTPPQLRVLAGGQSNPTFLISAGEGRDYVLRKKPPGTLIASAHAIDREFRVMKALGGTGVPVPRMLAYCDDVGLIGTPFYVMEYLRGRSFMDQALPGMQASERAAIYREMNRVIVALHAVSYAAVGLADYGREGNYIGRQIARWSRQCEASSVPLNASMRRLMDWLPGNLPPGDETTLVHGDYRLDNLIFHASEPRVIGVLDWELSTLGHPLADLAYQCMAWRIPHDLWRGIGGLDLASLGIPPEGQYVAWYELATGRSAAQHWDFYMAYNLFRMAAILHGIAQRAADGNAAAQDAVETGRKAGPLADLGWQAAQRYMAR